MTSAERKALAFLAGVGALGMAARALGVGAPPEVDLPGGSAAEERGALARQIAAVDSARAERQAARGAGRKRAKRPRRNADEGGAGNATLSPVTGATPVATWSAGTDFRPLTPAPAAADTRPRDVLPARHSSAPSAAPAGPVDADRADSATLERLPGVGPALARRVVADRRARGPFGSMAGLSRVPGVGPALERRLAPLVVFSGAAAP